MGSLTNGLPADVFLCARLLYNLRESSFLHTMLKNFQLVLIAMPQATPAARRTRCKRRETSTGRFSGSSTCRSAALCRLKKRLEAYSRNVLSRNAQNSGIVSKVL